MKQLTPQGARAVASMAYLFTFPLVMNYRDMYRQAIDFSSSAFSGGFGTWRQTHTSQPRTSGAGRPREDVVHSSIWLDLRAEPWWWRVGDVSPDVSFSGCLVDLWGYRLADCEARRHAGIPVLASAPVRLRDVPPEIEEIARGESAFGVLRTETRWSDPYRLPGDEPVEPDIELEPLTTHLGRTAPPPASTIPWWPWQDGIEVSDEYWSCANFALSLTTPNPQDRPIYERIVEIGVAPGARWAASAFSDEVVEAIRSGMDDALSDLLEAASEPRGRGLLRPVTRAELDRDYFRRALSAVVLTTMSHPEP